eukprot:Gb_15743 [translate_table: standard]
MTGASTSNTYCNFLAIGKEATSRREITRTVCTTMTAGRAKPQGNLPAGQRVREAWQAGIRMLLKTILISPCRGGLSGWSCGADYGEGEGLAEGSAESRVLDGGGDSDEGSWFALVLCPYGLLKETKLPRNAFKGGVLDLCSFDIAAWNTVWIESTTEPKSKEFCRRRAWHKGNLHRQAQLLASPPLVHAHMKELYTCHSRTASLLGERGT